MYFTSNLVDSATSRLLMNYTIRDGGAYISPRMGLRMGDVQEVIHKEVPYRPTDKIPGVHAAFYGMYRDSDGLDKFGDIFVSFGVPSSYEYHYYDTNEDAIDSSFRDQVFTNVDGDAFGVVEDSEGEIFTVDMSEVEETRLRFYKDTVKPLYEVFNNKLYTIDGGAGEKIGSEEYVSTGEIVKEMRFQYDGQFEEFTIRPVGQDYEPFDIVVVDAQGEEEARVSLTVPLLHLESNGVYSRYDGIKNAVFEKVSQYYFNDVHSEEDLIVEEKTNTVFLKIPKNNNSFAKGSVEKDVYKTYQIEGVQEINMTEADVLDHENNIGKFSARVDEDYLIYVMYPMSTVEDGLYDLNQRIVKFELLNEVEHSMGVSNPFPVPMNGRISIEVPKGPFRLRANFRIKYDRPIYAYLGGIQEYTFTKSGNEFRAMPKTIEAKQPKISEATAIGFNMLHANPYSFSNTEGIVLQPLGIMPYKVKSAQEILMSANLGEEIEFECIYEYEKGAKYYVKWEYLPLTVGPLREPTVLYESNKPFAAGTRVKQIVKANDEKFSLRVTMYPEKDGKKDEATARVVLYPVYEVGNGYLKDISSHQYDLHNARGIGKYKTMLSLWGVPGADTTLFFSDIDDVSYFPFPNNIVSFNHKVLGTHEYMGGLLVITTDSIYVIEGDQPKDFVVTEIYQGLKFTPEDVESLKVIKNMIFIRSGNNYYSIIPNTYTGELSDVKLHTISAPIKELTSDWDEFLKFLSTSVYNLDLEWTRRTKVTQYDFFNYISKDDTIKNVYRFVIHEDQVGADKRLRYQIDVVLNFHTDKGIWTLETINLPFSECVAYKNKIYTSFSTSFGEETKTYIQELEYKNSSRKDYYNTTAFGYYDNDIQTSREETALQELPDTYEDVVERVIDGDTIVTKELGTIRFHYVDAPEDTTESEEFGPEATQIIKDFFPVGSKVTLEFEGDRTDKYGRVLAWLFNEEGKLAQLHLAEQGGVKSIYAFGVRKYSDEVYEAVEESIKNKVGLWATYDGELEIIYTMKTSDILPNYQVMDTGNKNHDPYLTKRYREFQFQISNRSTDALVWFNRFYINSRPMQDFRSYELYHEKDPAHPDYGTITVIPIDESNLLSEAATFLNYWKLGENAFPELDIVRIRFKLSGKGTYPRLLMISKNEADYDFIGYSWIMRQMNYR